MSTTAVEETCSGAEDYLIGVFPDIEIPPVNTIIDAVLNTNLIKGSKEIWKHLFEAIQGIRRTCLLQLVDI